MPARGARTTDVAFQTAPILRTSNAMPRLPAWQHIAHLIHSLGPPTAPPPAVGTHPVPRSAISAPISESSHFERYWLGACARSRLALTRPGTQLNGLRNGLRICVGALRQSWSADGKVE